MAKKSRGGPVLGPFRVCWVRIEVGSGAARYELVGTAHRRPVARQVSRSTAMLLIAQGTPVVRIRADHADHAGQSGQSGRTSRTSRTSGRSGRKVA